MFRCFNLTNISKNITTYRSYEKCSNMIYANKMLGDLIVCFARYYRKWEFGVKRHVSRIEGPKRHYTFRQRWSTNSVQHAHFMLSRCLWSVTGACDIIVPHVTLWLANSEKLKSKPSISPISEGSYLGSCDTHVYVSFSCINLLWIVLNITNYIT